LRRWSGDSTVAGFIPEKYGKLSIRDFLLTAIVRYERINAIFPFFEVREPTISSL